MKHKCKYGRQCSYCGRYFYERGRVVAKLRLRARYLVHVLSHV